MTLKDYEALAAQVPRVGRAKAVAQVYSSILLYVQSQDDGTTTPGVDEGEPTDSWNALATNVLAYLSDKVPVGATVTVLPPTYVDLGLELNITVAPAYRQKDVRFAVNKALVGTGGLFAYDHYGFGDTVAVSDIIARVVAVPGVSSLTVTTLDRLGETGGVDVEMAANEIPRMIATNITLNLFGGLLT